ncbi:type II toxin-antitoxin system HicA family toxin [Thiorhodospira sibirica]|uniref:type II toxin-antitoxin system HicA family toxin n=1 Tax=Thiorhodospira sibirica TaxID=154347 RepID=UPI001C279518
MNCEIDIRQKLCRILKAQGWILKRIQGSHYIYVHEEQNHILTPTFRSKITSY